MLTITFNRLDQVGNEIIAAFELDIDSAPRFAHQVLPFDKPVVSANEPEDQQQHEADQDDAEQHNQPLISNVLLS